MNKQQQQPRIDAARWQAQEQARRGDRGADALDVRVADALRHAPAVQLPVDFAAQMAELVQAQAADDMLLEQRLLRGLQLVFALSAGIVVAWYGRGWTAALMDLLPGHAALAWVAAAGICVFANWAWDVLRKQWAHAVQAAA